MTPAYEGDPEPPKLVPPKQVPPKLVPKEQRHLTRRAVTVGLSLGFCLSMWPAAVDAQSVGDVFRRAAPSVVVIRARGRDVEASGPTRFSETGSGVLISSDGKVMTAAHVVHTMDEVTVEFLGGETVKARVLSSEPAADLSLLQLERVPAGTRVARLADSNVVRVGDQVMVIGAPYGLSHSLSVGWISARWAPNTVYKALPLAEFFQTDASINTGNSGGPMLNMAGEVIGIVSHNISKSGGSEGLGFVATVNTAKQLLLERRSFWTGLEGQLLSSELADLFNLRRGCLASWSRRWPRARRRTRWGYVAAPRPPSSMARPWWWAATSCSRSKALPWAAPPTPSGSGITWASSPPGRPSRPR